jgi:hypothetical protein
MKKFPKRAKLTSDGGFSSFIPIPELKAKIIIPVMRRISLSEPTIDYTEMWHFELHFSLQRVTKRYAEYRQIDSIKVAAPKTPLEVKD